MERARLLASPVGMRTLAVALTLAVVSGCVLSEPPSVRDLPLGDGRRYVEGEHRYGVHFELQKAGRAAADIPTQASTLDLRLLETVSVSRGRPARVTVSVVDAATTGADATGERTAALGRYLAITPRGTSWEIAFSGGALGTEGQVRAADLALLSHLMAPTEPKLRPAVGESVPEHATINTGWSTQRLDLRGESQRTEDAREKGRAVSHYGGTLSAQAPVSVRLGYGPAVTRTDIDNAAAFGALTCLFTLVLPCIVAGAYLSAIPEPTVDMTGPMSIAHQAVIHRASGRLLRLDGQGHAQIGGALPTARPPRSGAQPEAVRLLSASPVRLDLSWRSSERLLDPWPRDPVPVGLLIGAALGLWLVVIAEIVVGSLYLSRRRR